jgi:transposase
MVLVDGHGLPLANHLDSASPSEVSLAEVTLAKVSVPRRGGGRPRSKPERVIADKAYDSKPLFLRLARRGIQLIAPHLSNRIPWQDGRHLRRLRRRWRVERTLAWLSFFRRLTVRWERYLSMYNAFFHLACMLIVLRRL